MNTVSKSTCNESINTISINAKDQIIKSKINKRHETRDASGEYNGFLIPIYNIHEGFHDDGKTPSQVYLTVVSKGKIKGPHLHFIRTGCFTCIKGDARFILKTSTGYEVIYSGDSNGYKSVIVPTGIPAAIQNIGQEDAYILNMPTPAWTPEMNDEHTADFNDFDFSF
jgi:dTDP-4-dehydrorhamnose 3,5-epimerase-like enzyme